MRLKVLAVAVALIGLFLNPRHSDAAEVRVLAIGATKPTLDRVIPEFERTTHHKVIVRFGPFTAQVVQERIANGEAVDAVFIGALSYDNLLKKGVIEPGVALGRWGVGIGIRRGAAKPDVSTAAALMATLLAAKSIGGLPDNGSVGTTTMTIFRRLGIADQLTPKYHAYPNGAAVVQALVRGDIELGFSVFADMGARKEIDYAGPVPPAVQVYYTAYGAVRTGAANSAAAGSFIELVHHMATPEFLKENWLVPAAD